MDTIQPPGASSSFTSCSRCHVSVRPTDYFCFNCGNNLKPKPADTSVTTQILLYGGSLLLPPMGIIWGIKYLRQQGEVAKIIGIVCIVLTIIILVIAVMLSVQLINSINEQVNQQLQGFTF